ERTAPQVTRQVKSGVSIPPVVQTKNGGLDARKSGATHAVSRKRPAFEAKRTTAAKVPADARNPRALAAASGSIDAAMKGAMSSTQRKFVYPSTRSPGLYTSPCPRTRFSA